jgi:hypothetical protein
MQNKLIKQLTKTGLAYRLAANRIEEGNHIFERCIIREDGTLIGPDGKPAGYYNAEAGIGWCNPGAYRRMMQYEANPACIAENYSGFQPIEHPDA